MTDPGGVLDLARRLAGRTGGAVREVADADRNDVVLVGACGAPVAVPEGGILVVDLGEGIEREPGAAHQAARRLRGDGRRLHAAGWVGSARGPRAVGIYTSQPPPTVGEAPDDFRVVAIIAAYNEVDVLEGVVRHLHQDQGVRTYVIDNWSDDGTYELARSLEDRGVIGVERFPPRPVGEHRWKEMLDRKVQVSETLDADWCIHNDADEFRESPWWEVPVRDGLHHVQQCGYNVVDHTVLDFVPIDDRFEGGDVVEELRWFRFGRNPGHFMQRKAWRSSGKAVDLSGTGGHNARFEGARAFPFNFLVRHYPIRSQAHGERKVFVDRLPRFPSEARARGWHGHYDHLEEGHRFTGETADLSYYLPVTFHERYLGQRLVRVGLSPEDRS